jgi:hypothetical protein
LDVRQIRHSIVVEDGVLAHVAAATTCALPRWRTMRYRLQSCPPCGHVTVREKITEDDQKTAVSLRQSSSFGMQPAAMQLLG